MRDVRVFSGSSHPSLAASIVERLSIPLAAAQLDKFSNGETSVRIGCSIRDKDVFVVQSGSSKINDDIIELCIMISACKGGSANKITAVMPYFPYSRQSKRKSIRGAITARMIANLLSIAGVHHIITVDLHASQMQGFFGKPVDNLFAEPLIARWVRHHVIDWQKAVVVSKNPGGTKRATSLADTLKLNFGIVTTDRRRHHMTSSVVLDKARKSPKPDELEGQIASEIQIESLSNGPVQGPSKSRPRASPSPSSSRNTDADEEYNDSRAHDVITGRLVHGHLVEDDYPSPPLPASMSASLFNLPAEPSPSSVIPDDPTTADLMISSAMSTSYACGANPDESPLGGAIDDTLESDDDDDEEEEGGEEHIVQSFVMEKTITLVGNVRGKVVLIVDDIIDKPQTWIAAAETVVKRGGATKVYCVATHGLFGNDCLEDMEKCECIDYIVVTNSFPIPEDKAKRTKKLVVLDLSHLLSEAIRRNHYGESLSQLFQYYND